MRDKSKNTMRVGIVVFLIIVIFLLSVFLFANFIDYLAVLDVEELYASVIVGDKYGLDVNGSALTFGMMPPGSTGTREFFLENKYKQDVRVKIYAKGDIADFLEISQNSFVLREDESRNVSVHVRPPHDAELRVYEGIVKVIISNTVIKD